MAGALVGLGPVAFFQGFWGSPLLRIAVVPGRELFFQMVFRVGDDFILLRERTDHAGHKKLLFAIVILDIIAHIFLSVFIGYDKSSGRALQHGGGVRDRRAVSAFGCADGRWTGGARWRRKRRSMEDTGGA